MKINFENKKALKKYAQRYENNNTFVTRISRRTTTIIIEREFNNLNINANTVYWYIDEDTAVLSETPKENETPYYVQYDTYKNNRKIITLPAYLNDMIFERVNAEIKKVALRLHIDRKNKLLYFSFSKDIIELI